MSYSEVNPKIKEKIKGLKMEFTNLPQPELLIPIPNPASDMNYKISILSPEFTSLCPLAPTQPDYATVNIEYFPKDLIIELKSLKFYLVSFRTVEIFHEAVVGTIIRDLVNACHPREMWVKATFTTRGGIDTTISASYNESKKFQV